MQQRRILPYLKEVGDFLEKGKNIYNFCVLFTLGRVRVCGEM